MDSIKDLDIWHSPVAPNDIAQYWSQISGSEDELDLLFIQINNICNCGGFDDINLALEIWDPSVHSDDMVLGLLTVTLACHTLLPARKRLAEYAWARFTEKHGSDRATKIMSGLDPD